MLSKTTTILLMITLLLCFTLSSAARAGPGLPENIPAASQLGGVETQKTEVADESCDGLGEDECLSRRTLVAHLDYIYTQNANP